MKIYDTINKQNTIIELTENETISEPCLTTNGDKILHTYTLSPLPKRKQIYNTEDNPYYNKDYFMVPEGIEIISRDVFCYSYELEDIILPSTLEMIKDGAFSYCFNLKKIDLSNTNLVSISEGAFQNCRNLEEVIFPDTLKVIKDKAFKDCNITNITLPATVSLGSDVFLGNPLSEDSIQNIQKITNL